MHFGVEEQLVLVLPMQVDEYVSETLESPDGDRRVVCPGSTSCDPVDTSFENQFSNIQLDSYIPAYLLEVVGALESSLNLSAVGVGPYHR